MADDMHPALVAWRETAEKLQWSALGIDADGVLVWMSTEMQQFLDASLEELGVGKHLATAYGGDAWTRVRVGALEEDFLIRMLGYGRHNLEARGRSADEIEGPLGQLMAAVEPLPLPPVDWGTISYIDPRLSSDTPPSKIHFLLFPLREENGEFAGMVTLNIPDVRANVLYLLGRGDQEMYERMARLVEPSRHASAILFCDLAASGRLSRNLSNVAYFNLVRSLWTRIDGVIAQNAGIIGKHAGDGASAYFLGSDFEGGAEEAAGACLHAAREIHELSSEVFAEVLDQPCQMRIGVHWSGGLFMGQLVPGGRLEVTALGDEVNETARIESCAEPGQTLASKHLLQQLGPDGAAELGLDLEKMRFTTLAEIPGANPKAIEEAGSLPVASFE